MFRLIQRLVFIAGITGLVALVVWPYHDGILRYGLPLSLAAAWSVALGFVWRRKITKKILLALPVLAAIPFLLPGRPMDRDRLRFRYLAALRSMEGVPYLWAGESSGGIDCSGLPRRALRDALWETGWRESNGAAFREWAKQWWFDTSAKALGENHRDFTYPLGLSGKLRKLDFQKFAPGDLAVTADGRHVMVYLGDGDWIQADPGPSKVTIAKPATDPNPWFDAPVTMQRWTVFKMRW